jgi:hypothetical protein
MRELSLVVANRLRTLSPDRGQYVRGKGRFEMRQAFVDKRAK